MIILWQGAPSSNHSPEVLHPTCREGFPGASAVKNLPAYAGNTIASGSISGSGRSPGGGNGNPLQYSCLENPMDRGAWRATGRRVLKDSDTALSTLALHREDTHPYLESRRGRSKMDAQVRTGDYGWTTLSQQRGPGYEVLGRRVRTQFLEEPTASHVAISILLAVTEIS